jgi:hypothetical protein
MLSLGSLQLQTVGQLLFALRSLAHRRAKDVQEFEKLFNYLGMWKTMLQGVSHSSNDEVNILGNAAKVLRHSSSYHVPVTLMGRSVRL